MNALSLSFRPAHAVALLLALTGCGALPEKPPATAPIAPPASTAMQKFAVATAHPLASEAGYQMLKAGGSAIDAAIAAQMVLTLVEPQSSGIGGGAFLLHFDGRSVDAFDGRETAPLAASENLFLGPDGKPLSFYDGVVGGRSVGTPGVLAMLDQAHRAHGKLPWQSLFQPAIRLAEEGFPVSPMLHADLSRDPHLKRDPVAAAYFYDAAGAPRPIGYKLKNPELAATLRLIASSGAQAFYRGEIARDIATKVRTVANPGLLTEADLANYQPKRRAAFCTDWKRWRVCGFPPPSSGAITVAQILGLIDQEALTRPDRPELANGLPSADWLHVYTEASRLAYADRNLYIADPDFVAAPGGDWQSLVAPRYLAARASLIGTQSMGTAPPGDPQAPLASGAGVGGESPEFPSTSHLSIIDADGKALAMTTTIEDAFGSRQMVRGFLLNNQLTDFSFAPSANGRPVANRVEPLKRPRSSMAPTLVFDRASGQLVMSVGSPGGAQIIHYTAKTLIGTLGLGLSPQEAINLPNFGSNNGPTNLEVGRFPAATLDALKARRHEVREIPMRSGIQAILRSPDGLQAGADRRREGRVAGE